MGLQGNSWLRFDLYGRIRRGSSNPRSDRPPTLFRAMKHLISAHWNRALGVLNACPLAALRAAKAWSGACMRLLQLIVILECRPTRHSAEGYFTIREVVKSVRAETLTRPVLVVAD